MLWDQMEQLRQCIENPKWPLSFDKWPKKLKEKTNCLAFSLGLNLAGPDYDWLISLNSEIPCPSFDSVFERLLTELGLEWKKINHADEALENEYVIQIYGFYQISLNYHPDFHVIRRELDGTWVHKPDFRNIPTSIISWSEFVLDYPDSEIAGTYAVRKKAH